jgi:hypothetical protein
MGPDASSRDGRRAPATIPPPHRPGSPSAPSASIGIVRPSADGAGAWAVVAGSHHAVGVPCPDRRVGWPWPGVAVVRDETLSAVLSAFRSNSDHRLSRRDPGILDHPVERIVDVPTGVVAGALPSRLRPAGHGGGSDPRRCGRGLPGQRAGPPGRSRGLRPANRDHLFPSSRLRLRRLSRRSTRRHTCEPALLPGTSGRSAAPGSRPPSTTRRRS